MAITVSVTVEIDREMIGLLVTDAIWRLPYWPSVATKGILLELVRNIVVVELINQRMSIVNIIARTKGAWRWAGATV